MNDINSAVSTVLQLAGASGFSENSRYIDLPTSTLELADGRTVAYVQRRLVPPPENFSAIQEYTVTEGERLDQIAAAALGDPESFWRLCDANGAIHPSELERVGVKLRITLSEGIPNPGA